MNGKIFATCGMLMITTIGNANFGQGIIKTVGPDISSIVDSSNLTTLYSDMLESIILSYCPTLMPEQIDVMYSNDNTDLSGFGNIPCSITQDLLTCPKKLNFNQTVDLMFYLRQANNGIKLNLNLLHDSFKGDILDKVNNGKCDAKPNDPGALAPLYLTASKTNIINKKSELPKALDVEASDDNNLNLRTSTDESAELSETAKPEENPGEEKAGDDKTGSQEDNNENSKIKNENTEKVEIEKLKEEERGYQKEDLAPEDGDDDTNVETSSETEDSKKATVSDEANDLQRDSSVVEKSQIFFSLSSWENGILRDFVENSNIPDEAFICASIATASTAAIYAYLKSLFNSAKVIYNDGEEGSNESEQQEMAGRINASSNRYIEEIKTIEAQNNELMAES